MFPALTDGATAYRSYGPVHFDGLISVENHPAGKDAKRLQVIPTQSFRDWAHGPRHKEQNPDNANQASMAMI